MRKATYMRVCSLHEVFHDNGARQRVGHANEVKIACMCGTYTRKIKLLEARLATSNVWRCCRRRRRRRRLRRRRGRHRQRRRRHRRRHRHPNSPGWRSCCVQSQYAHMPENSNIQHVQLPGLAVSSTWCAQCQWARWRCILLWYEHVEQ